jgi:predicted nucleotidyltransferase
MLETLISSKTRVKLLLKFFLNAQAKGYLRSLEQEFGESTNAIRLELNKFEEAGMLSSETKGNKKVYTANPKHPLFENLHGLVMKYVGLDKIVDSITERLGQVEAIYLVGDYAEGRDSGIIDLFILATDLNLDYLLILLDKAEQEIERKIRYVHFKTRIEIEKLLGQQSYLLIWEDGH